MLLSSQLLQIVDADTLTRHLFWAADRVTDIHEDYDKDLCDYATLIAAREMYAAVCAEVDRRQSLFLDINSRNW